MAKTLRNLLWATAVAAASCTATAQNVQRAAAPDLQLYGSIIGSFGDPGSYYNESGGIYTFNLRKPSAVTLVKSGIRTYGGGAYAQGSYYRTDYTESSNGSRITMPIRLYRTTTSDWAQISLHYGYSFSCITYDMTFDPETREMYAIFSDEDYSNKKRLFGRFRYKEQQGVELYECDSIAAFPEVMVALAADRNGTLYAIDKKANLYTVDKYNGATKLIGNTGVATQAMFQSATCNYSNGKIYWATIYNDMWDTGIFEVDPTTAKSTLVSDFGYDNGTGTCDQFTGIYFKEDLDLQSLPDTVTNLSATFTTDTEGSVTFTLPSTTTDGDVLSGNVNYTVRLNGTPVANGTAEAGKQVSVPLQVENEGEAKVSVVAQRPATSTQPAATSHEAKTAAWAGHDVPEKPARVSIRANGNDITVSWKAPSQGVHRGYIDADNMTFTLTRYVEGRDKADAVVAKAQKETTFTDHIASDEKLTYYYTITARNGNFTSAPATTRTVTLGTQIGFPYTNALETSPLSDGFTVIDANADDNTWTYSETDKSMTYEANEKPADDWFVTPAFSVKKGAIYTFSFTAKSGYTAERVAAYLGTAPTAEALTTEVIAPQDIAQAYSGQTLKGTFRATADATLHFGIHATSNANAGTLQVSDLNFTECPVTAPEPVSCFKATPGAKGINQADITFTAPSATLEGTALEGKLSVDIVRDGKTLKTLTDVLPGATCSYSDTYVSTDFHTYAATVTAADGQKSVETEQRIFVGLDKPGPVRNLRVVEDLDKEGLVHLTWDAPETGMNGGYIDPEGLTYYISGGVTGSSSDFSVGSATHYDEQLSPNGKQVYQAYSVYAGNSAGNGRSQVWQTASVIAGPALKAPVFESFDNATMKSGPWLTKMTNGKIGETYCYVMNNTPDFYPADLDGGMQVFSATSVGKSARSESPKVDISALNKPVLHFWAYLNGKDDSLTVSVSPDYKGFEPQLHISGADGTGWKRFTIDLAPYLSSRFIQIGFEGKAVSSLEYFMAYDNVSITDTYAYDLMARSLTSPEEMNTQEESNFKVSIRNNGENDVKGTDYAVVLYRNGREAARTEGDDLAADAKTEFMLSDKASVLGTKKNVYQVAIVFAADENSANNTTATDTVKVVLPDYPTPTGLKAGSSDSGVSLNWTAPDLEHMKKQSYTETFEDFPAFTISDLGEWTVVDGDKQETKRISLSSVMGALSYDHAGEAMAYQVFNVTQAGIPLSTWDPHSGEQMLLCFAASSSDGNPVKPNDDWLISPELDGTQQTIRFYAKAAQGSSYVPEKIQLLYSLESTDTTTFVKVSEMDITNYKTWDECSFNVPEGAKHFAIRCVSENKLALMLDDITFIPAGAESVELTLKGYNVYRDSLQLNAQPVASTSYVDASAAKGNAHSYLVTAVYAEGESLPSNAAGTDGTSGIALPAVSAVCVSTTAGTVTVSGAENLDVTLYTADGRTLASRKATARETFRVAPGVYVVTAGNVHTKVVVK